MESRSCIDLLHFAGCSTLHTYVILVGCQLILQNLQHPFVLVIPALILCLSHVALDCLFQLLLQLAWPQTYINSSVACHSLKLQMAHLHGPLLNNYRLYHSKPHMDRSQ